MKFLLLSHAFNMDGRAASQTVTDKIPHLLSRGYVPVVLSAKTGLRDSVLEHHQLYPWGPRALRFDLRHVFKTWRRHLLLGRSLRALSNLCLAIPSLLERLLVPLEGSWSWALPAYFRGKSITLKGDIEFIFSSGGSTSAHLAALWLKRKYGIPWIVEVHDPLYYEEWEKGFIFGKFSRWLEERICSEASYVYWFTKSALRAATERNPGLGPRGGVIFPGRDNPFLKPIYIEKAAKLDFSYFGSLSPTRSLSPFLYALFHAIGRRPSLGGDVVVRIFGGRIDDSARRTLKELKLEEIIDEKGRLEHDRLSGQSGRERVLEEMRRSQVLVLVHGQQAVCREYIPSKVYEYFWCGRPIIAIVKDNEELSALLDSLGHTPFNFDDLEGVSEKILSLHDNWLANEFPRFKAESPYTVEKCVETLCSHISKALAVDNPVKNYV